MTNEEKNSVLTIEHDLIFSGLGIDPADLAQASTSLRQIEKIIGGRVYNQRILDVGCGSEQLDRMNRCVMPPALPLLLAVCGAQAYGIDPGTQDPRHTDLIQQYGGDIIKLTITSLHKALNEGRNPFGSPLDVVITENVIGDNPDPDFCRRDPENQRLSLADQRSKYLAVCRMVLKPGGVAFFDWSNNQIEDEQRIGKYTYWRKPEQPMSSVNGNLFSSQ